MGPLSLSIAVMTIAIYGVSTPYAWEIVETLKRLDKPILCIDNLGGADLRLPGMRSSVDLSTPIILGPGSPVARYKCSQLAFNHGYLNLATITDPSSVIAGTVKMAHGVYVNTLSSVGSNTVINCGVNINRSASVGHDCLIENFACIGPGVVLAGRVEIGHGVLVGAGAVVLPNIKIGHGAVIGAGAVVTKNVLPGEIVAGNPAKKISSSLEQEDKFTCPYH
jgi:sugar O-acyltransferase (sialic acid O-acetyltransferase NeuD family)